MRRTSLVIFGLDRLELLLVIEDQYTDLVITDNDVDQKEVSQARHIENDCRRRSIPEASLQ